MDILDRDIVPFALLMKERFVNRAGLYYVQWANDPENESLDYKSGYGRRNADVTPEVIIKHFAHEVTVSLPPMDEDGNCKWCLWDNDHENGNLAKIEKILRSLDLHALRDSVRPEREGHLTLHFDQKVSARDLQRFDRFVRDSIPDLVIEDQLEFFPKQDRPCDANGVRMPLGLNRKWKANGAEGWFEGPPKNLADQLVWFSQQRLNSGVRIARLAHQLRLEDKLRPKPPRRSPRAGAISMDAVADLNPVEHNTYFICDCPSCGERTAYFYKGGNTLVCNRKNNCGLTMSLADLLNP